MEAEKHPAANPSSTASPQTVTKADNNLTMSTAKLSTDQLICKTPRESPSASVKSLVKESQKPAAEPMREERTSIVLYISTLQTLLGILMAILGVLALARDASLSQIGGGLWGGCVAVAAGMTGALASAKDCCPLRRPFRKTAQTISLALSLISLAVANLVLVLTATGLARDAAKIDTEAEIESDNTYGVVLVGAGLLIVCAAECIAAAASAYVASRLICPCFRPMTDEERARFQEYGHGNKHMLVSNWLQGKHGPLPQPVFVVSTTKRKGVVTPPVAMTPVYPFPPPGPPPPILGYPLLPPPMATMVGPPGIITHPHRTEMMQHKRKRFSPERKSPGLQKSRKPRKHRQLTAEDVARTYTGLDRTIAEEFIEICDSARNSSSSSSDNNTAISGGTSSDTVSNELTTEKL